MVDVDPDTLATMLIYATRYCLGRHSYAPGQMCELLGRYARQLGDTDREIIIRDITKYVSRERRGHEPPDPCRSYWERVVEELSK